MWSVWIIPMIVLVVRTVGSQQGCPPARLPDAQPRIPELWLSDRHHTLSAGAAGVVEAQRLGAAVVR